MQCVKDPNQRNVGNLNTVKRDGSISGIKIRNIRELKIDELKLTLRQTISETYTVASLTLRRATSLELIQ